MTNPLEACFGWYRQESGENFFISFKQLFLAEKKIRCLSLLLQQVLLSAADIKRAEISDDVVSRSSEHDDSAYVELSDFLKVIVLWLISLLAT